MLEKSKLTRLIENICNISYQKFFTSKSIESNTYGFNEPRIELTLWDKHTNKYKLSIGAKTEVGYKLYFKTEDPKKNFLGSEYIYLMLNVSNNFLRDKNIFNFKANLFCLIW